MKGRASLGPLVGLAMVAVLAGCESTKPPPTPLQPVVAQASDRVVWKGRVGSVRAPLGVATTPSLAVAASSDGQVTAFDAQTGAVKWTGRVPGKLSAGVGSDGRYAGVVTDDNQLIVLDAGAVKWQSTLPTRVVTAPLVAGERVFVLGLDRSVTAFDVRDGRKLWELRRPGDPLALAQPGVLQPVQDVLLAGIGPKLTALDSVRGTVRQEWAIATPRGTNDVERLADLVAPVARSADTVCVRAYQATVTCLRVTDGRTAWTRPAPGYAGVAVAASIVAGADASDRITGWKLGDGAPAWSNQTLLYRELSAPGATDKALVFGDREGWVHFLSPADGRVLQRVATDGSAITTSPRMAGRTLIVTTRDGGVFGIRAD